jgi:hypothetical protein
MLPGMLPYMLPYWPQLALFASVVLLVSLYGLVVSGHFPAEFRGEQLQGPWGAAVLWGSMGVTAAATAAALTACAQHLPWYAAVIGGGAMVLFAPLLLRPLPDSFVNSRLGLLLFGAGAAIVAAALWVAF